MSEHSMSFTYNHEQSHAASIPPEMWATVCVCSDEEARAVCAAVPRDYAQRGDLLELLFTLFDYGVGVDDVVKTAHMITGGNDDETP